MSDIIVETGRTREELIVRNISGVSRSDILKRIIECDIDVEHFESYKPSLNDIFVSLVGDEAEDDKAAGYKNNSNDDSSHNSAAAELPQGESSEHKMLLRRCMLMKKLGVVLQYELMTYLKNKSYVISTVIIALIAVIIMFVPRFIDISAITGITNSTEQNSDSDKDNSDGKSNSDKDNKADNNKDVILIYDESGVFEDVELIQAAFDDMKIEKSRLRAH